MHTCNIENCDLPTYGDLSKCVLHCEKSSYNVDRDKAGFLRSFYNRLVTHISNFILETGSKFKITDIEEALNKPREASSSAVMHEIKSSGIALIGIKFPDRRSQDDFDYLSILKLPSSIWFRDCTFTYGGHGLGERSHSRLFFDSCLFKTNWAIENVAMLGNTRNATYYDCTFQEDVHTSASSDEPETIDFSIFSDCTFKKNLKLYNTTFESEVFNNTEPFNQEIAHLAIEKCILNGKLIGNNFKINDMQIIDCEFNNKVELKRNTTKSLTLHDSNFRNLVDVHGSTFKTSHIEKCIFYDFVAMENCNFGTGTANTNSQPTMFKYTTFLGFVTFRDTTFNNGLDLQQANLKETPNFLNINININNTNRETFRIIKHSFDKVGNIIEGNKFYAYEMIKYSEEIKQSNELSKRIILFINKKVSNFGQNYYYPIAWLIFFAAIYSFLIYSQEQNYLYKIYPPLNGTLHTISEHINDIFRHIIPFKNILRDGMEFISLIFYVIFVSLIWQTVVAVKRHTKR